jgi:pimeloyl-ACP methyl ester carboxylesterase
MSERIKLAIYILHGWAVDPANEAKWQEVRQHLDAAGIKTHFVGLPGLTVPLPSETPWKLADYEQWLLKQLPEQAVIVLGHSFGGQLAVRLAAQHPDRVEKLILIDSSGIRDHSARSSLKRKFFYVVAKLGKVFSFLPFARKVLYRLAGEKDYFTAPPPMRQTMANVLAEEIVLELPLIKQETLLIWGSEDTITPIQNLQYFRKIPRSVVKIVAAARHSPQFTHPETVGQLVAAFLKKE